MKETVREVTEAFSFGESELNCTCLRDKMQIGRYISMETVQTIILNTVIVRVSEVRYTLKCMFK